MEGLLDTTGYPDGFYVGPFWISDCSFYIPREVVSRSPTGGSVIQNYWN